jgi:glucokinase
MPRISGNSENHSGIGVDIGGTKILGCLFAGTSSQPIETITMPTVRKLGGRAVIRQTSELIAQLRSKTSHPIEVVGIAIPELVDPSGNPASAWNFDWRHLDVIKELGLECPVLIESDVRAAAFAESRLSEFKNLDPLLYITLSTGLSHTLIIDGKPYVGARGFALHFAGSDLVTECQNCGETTPYNLELSAGGRALGERYTLMKNQGELTARDLFDAYETDPIAKKMADNAITCLASFIAQLINTLDPSGLIIGGGIGTRTDVFDQLEQETRRYIWSDVTRGLPIAASELGGRGVAIGSFLRAKEALLRDHT